MSHSSLVCRYRLAGNVDGLPQYGPTLNWAAVNWRTFFIQANLRQPWHISKWTIPNVRVVASQCWWLAHFKYAATQNYHRLKVAKSQVEFVLTRY